MLVCLGKVSLVCILDPFRSCALLLSASPSRHCGASGWRQIFLPLGFQGPAASVFTFTCEMLLQMERCLCLNTVLHV